MIKKLLLTLGLLLHLVNLTDNQFEETFGKVDNDKPVI